MRPYTTRLLRKSHKCSYQYVWHTLLIAACDSQHCRELCLAFKLKVCDSMRGRNHWVKWEPYEQSFYLCSYTVIAGDDFLHMQKRLDQTIERTLDSLLEKSPLSSI